MAVFVDLLRRWQRVKNLVGPSTLDRIWTRHVADSAQLVALAPGALAWADMGSGAGFPGMIIAIQLAQTAGARVDLIEANARKCAFLREAARECGAPALVHNGRVEAVLPALGRLDVVTARALASLPRLLQMGNVALIRGALGIFLKSRSEIDELGVQATSAVSVLPSRTSQEGRIVLYRATEDGTNPAVRQTIVNAS